MRKQLISLLILFVCLCSTSLVCARSNEGISEGTNSVHPVSCTASCAEPVCQLVAADGTTVLGLFASLQEAFDAVNSDNCTVQLLKHYTPAVRAKENIDYVLPKYDVTLDLVNYRLHPLGDFMFEISDTHTLYIKGNACSKIFPSQVLFATQNGKFVFTKEFLGTCEIENEHQLCNGGGHGLVMGGTYTLVNYSSVFVSFIPSNYAITGTSAFYRVGMGVNPTALADYGASAGVVSSVSAGAAYGLGNY